MLMNWQPIWQVINPLLKKSEKSLLAGMPTLGRKPEMPAGSRLNMLAPGVAIPVNRNFDTVTVVTTT